MKKTVFLILLFALIAIQPVFAKSGQLQILNVINDKNVVAEGGPYSEHYWVETDGTRGVIHLTFPGQRKVTAKAKAVFLIINIPNIKDSGSNTGCEIVQNGKVIGKLSSGKPGSWVEIPLKKVDMSKTTIQFTIRGGGQDGLAIYSKASGFGPLLKLVY